MKTKRKSKTIHDGWRVVMPGGTVGSVYYAKKSDVEKDIRNSPFLAYCTPGSVRVTFTPVAIPVAVPEATKPKGRSKR